jgi:glycerophosphoryl diester phosphodiesterase
MRLPILVLLTSAAFGQTTAPLVVAHRGGKLLRPENTLAAFRYAAAIGADVIEFDVGVTSDDRLVVNHDTSINETNCSIPGERTSKRKLFLRSLSFEATQRFDCGSRRPEGFTHWQPAPGARIPALEEVFKLLHGQPVQLLIEMKMAPDESEGFTSPAHFAQLLHRAIERHNMKGQVIIQSGDYRTLQEMRKLDPEIRLCQLSLWRHSANWVQAAKDFGGTHQLVTNSALTAEAVRDLKASGITVISSTVNDAVGWKHVFGLGVDGILTDDPYNLIEYLKQMGLRR